MNQELLKRIQDLQEELYPLIADYLILHGQLLHYKYLSPNIIRYAYMNLSEDLQDGKEIDMSVVMNNFYSEIDNKTLKLH